MIININIGIITWRKYNINQLGYSPSWFGDKLQRNYIVTCIVHIIHIPIKKSRQKNEVLPTFSKILQLITPIELTVSKKSKIQTCWSPVVPTK